jgi:hypothetical protein
MFVFYYRGVSYYLDYHLKFSMWLASCYSFFFYWFYVFLNDNDGTLGNNRIGKRVFWTNFG